MSIPLERSRSPKLRTLVATTWWVLGSVVLPNCGAKVATESPTETGNPPVIEQSKIRVIGTDEGVRIVGGAGSVPGVMVVTVTNLDSGRGDSTTSDPSGGFDIVIEGKLDDEFEVSVDGTTVVVDAATNPEVAFQTCEQVSQRAEELRDELETFAAKDCTRDDDCVLGDGLAECTAFLCGFSFHVVDGRRAAVYDAVGSAEEEVCSAQASLGCEFGVGADCAVPEPATYAPACVDGVCVDSEPPNPCSFEGYAEAVGFSEATTECGSVEYTYDGDTPDDVATAVFDCFRDAFSGCRPATLHLMGMTLEGDPVYTDYHVLEGTEVCEIQAFHDSREDKYAGGGRATRSRCTGLEPNGGPMSPEPLDCETVATCAILGL